MPTENANFNFLVKIERLFLAHGNGLAFNFPQVVSAGISPRERAEKTDVRKIPQTDVVQKPRRFRREL